MATSDTVRGSVRGMAGQSNPTFAAAAFFLPLAALGYALTVASVTGHTYVHVMAGVPWTGIDLFFGVVLGPVVGRLHDEARAAVFRRLTPKMTFLMPALALTTIAAGIDLALRLGYFPHAGPWLALFTLANLPPALLLIGWQFDALRDWRWLVPFGVATVASIAWVALTVGDLRMTTPVSSSRWRSSRCSASRGRPHPARRGPGVPRDAVGRPRPRRDEPHRDAERPPGGRPGGLPARPDLRDGDDAVGRVLSGTEGQLTRAPATDPRP